MDEIVLQSIHTTSRGHYLIQELHAGSLPDLLDHNSKLLIGLLQVTLEMAEKMGRVTVKLLFLNVHSNC